MVVLLILVVFLLPVIFFFGYYFKTSADDNPLSIKVEMLFDDDEPVYESRVNTAQPRGGYSALFDDDEPVYERKTKKKSKKKYKETPKLNSQVQYNTPYTVLGLTENCSHNEICAAYKRLSKCYHPDINKEPEALNKFIGIQRAYEFLRKNHIENKHVDLEELVLNNKPATK